MSDLYLVFLLLFAMESATAFWHYANGSVWALAWIVSILMPFAAATENPQLYYLLVPLFATTFITMYLQVMYTHTHWSHRPWFMDSLAEFTWWHLIGSFRHVFTVYALFLASGGDLYSWQWALAAFALAASTKRGVWYYVKRHYRPFRYT
jgi:hypothetical protein